ncbi:hypothetical protein J6590_004112 [Homalodisca vitripennis]|nr:hypothetical protein J6590_004112 [Homalodisca vitripennis]
MVCDVELLVAAHGSQAHRLPLNLSLHSVQWARPAAPSRCLSTGINRCSTPSVSAKMPSLTLNGYLRRILAPTSSSVVTGSRVGATHVSETLVYLLEQDVMIGQQKDSDVSHYFYLICVGN